MEVSPQKFIQSYVKDLMLAIMELILKVTAFIFIKELKKIKKIKNLS